MDRNSIVNYQLKHVAIWNRDDIDSFAFGMLTQLDEKLSRGPLGIFENTYSCRWTVKYKQKIGSYILHE